MTKQLLKWLYRRYHKVFMEIVVEETFYNEDIPRAANDRALEFLAKNRRTFEPWLIWQAYEMQRRYVNVNPKSSDVYLGCLFYLRVLYLAASKGKILPEGETEHKMTPNEAKQEAPNVDDIISKIKERRDTPT